MIFGNPHQDPLVKEEQQVIDLGYFFFFQFSIRKKTTCITQQKHMMSTQNICFYGEIREIIPELSLKTLQNGR